MDWPSLIIRHMARIIDLAPVAHHLTFGNLLSIVFKEFKVPLDVGHPLTKKDIVDWEMT